MGVDEEGTLARLKALRRELADPKIKEHRGRIVKTTGDGLLLAVGGADLGRDQIGRIWPKNASFAGDFLARDLLDRPLSRLGDVNGAMTR
jgi:class 3 adenylate cyclase